MAILGFYATCILVCGVVIAYYVHRAVEAEREVKRLRRVIARPTGDTYREPPAMREYLRVLDRAGMLEPTNDYARTPLDGATPHKCRHCHNDFGAVECEQCTIERLDAEEAALYALEENEKIRVSPGSTRLKEQ